jgi:hypothetical protein
MLPKLHINYDWLGVSNLIITTTLAINRRWLQITVLYTKMQQLIIVVVKREVHGLLLPIFGELIESAWTW